MSHVERPFTPVDADHHNPELIEWSLPEEGLEIRLLIDQPEMAELSDQSYEHLTLASSLFVLLCDYIVANREALQGAGLTTEGAFGFMAEHLKDMTSLFRMMTGELASTRQDEFPF